MECSMKVPGRISRADEQKTREFLAKFGVEIEEGDDDALDVARILLSFGEEDDPRPGRGGEPGE
jgi:hypothetical protein